MPKPKKERLTTNVIGSKINQIMKAKGIVGDYALVAQHFGIKVPSVYGWIDKGTIAKDRYEALVEWSGQTLGWWFGADDIASKLSGVRHARPSEPAHETVWPFETFTRTQWARLEKLDRARVESYALGLLHAKHVVQKNLGTRSNS